MAAAWRNATLCRELTLTYGANVNAVNATRWTPLMYAAHHGHVPTCVLLLTLGADAAARSRNGYTAAQWALRVGNPAAAAAIGAWLAARAFAQGTRHARRTHVKQHWTDSKLFDVNLIAEITAYVV
jgi:hypothetical protein